jgi:hypothetical protein
MIGDPKSKRGLDSALSLNAFRSSR